MLANWDDDGGATFHQNCWRRLRHAYLSEKKIKNNKESATRKEKEMIEEA